MRGKLSPEHCWILEKPIAHRGKHDDGAPENSLAAFRAAVEAGCAIELDARLLADGGVAVFHDDHLKRMTGVDWDIGALDSEAIRRLRLLGGDEPVPLLRDVLGLVNGAVGILIEVKNEGAVHDLEAAVLSELSDYSGPVAVQSFNPLTVLFFRKHAPALIRGQLGGDFRDSSMSGLLKAVLRTMPLNWLARPDFIAYDIDSMPRPLTDRIRSSGRPLIAWTVRTPEQRQKALELADNYIFEGLE